MATAKMLEIKNWRKFQHYKDRSPPWIKLYASVFDDAEFACLKDTSKLALICIWILSRQLDGKVPNCAAWIKKRAGLDGDVDLQDLINNGFLIPLADCAQDASKLSQNRDNMPPSENREEENTEKKKIHTPLPPKGGKGEGGREKANRFTRDKPDPRAQAVYDAYPRKEAKREALFAISNALARVCRGADKPGGDSSVWPPPDEAAWLEARTKLFSEFIAGTDPQYIPFPATWFNQSRYLTDPKTWVKRREEKNGRERRHVTGGDSWGDAETYDGSNVRELSFDDGEDTASGTDPPG